MTFLNSEVLNDFAEKSAEYRKRSEKYLNNAMLEASKKNFAKASEFLWGAIAEAAKAIYALSGQPLRGHKEINRALRELVHDEELTKRREFLRTANQLHTNFYEGSVDEVEFLLLSQTAYKLLSKLFGIWRTQAKGKQ